jgi:succinate-semialdehyde dehydrogenase/glutarate-semialdehyde dehydrogenase
MNSINPATGQIIKEYVTESFASVQAKLTSLHDNFLSWKQLPVNKRIDVINNAATLLETNKVEYAYIMTSEMGKVKTQAIQEIEKCALACEYYAKNAVDYLASKPIKTEGVRSYIHYSPLGIILGIMPWNFPFWQVFRFAIPTLLAGNVIILKHASSVPGCALALETIFSAAAEDLNLQIFRSVLLDSKHIEQVIVDPLVQAVTLTGSVEAGKSVAAIAGSQIKKTVLELGGSDPYIILADADIDNAASACTKGRLLNCGQSCIAAKRLIVVKDVYDEFLTSLIQQFSELKIGDPNDSSTNIGPLASKQVLDTIVDQVTRTIAAGATCVLGGEKINGEGYYYQPTILTNIPVESPAMQEEIFGPVACVFCVANEQEAIELANNTVFGLGAAIFTRNLEHAAELAEQHINAGNVFVNSIVASDPRLPFGGIKQSGYGRELSGLGIHEFVNIKTIKINA